MRIALLGSEGVPTVAYYAAALRAAGHDADIFYNDKTESEVGRQSWQQRTHGLLPPLPQVTSPRSLSVRALKDYDLAINGGIIQILGRPFLHATRHGVLNVHPGILPRYRGCTAVEWALFNGDPIGCTAHLMDESIDTGPIIRVEEVERCETYVETRVAVYRACFQLAARAVGDLKHGKTPVPQTEGTYWQPIDQPRLAQVIGSFDQQ